jgi:predicted transcriptional regulator
MKLTNAKKAKKLAVDNDLAEWCSVLSSQSASVEPVPAGWKTILQLAEELGKSRAHTSHQVQAAYKAGTLERKIFSIVTGDKIYPVPHYKVVKK